jgi:hypothetical protein
MPKLLVFAPCEKVIISQEGNNPTLVNLINMVGGDVEVAGNAPIGSVVVPYSWVVFSMWLMLPEDAGKTFQQQFRLVAPSGTPALVGTATLEFVAGPGSTHRVLANIGGMPAAEKGTWQIEMRCRESADPSWSEFPAASYPLNLNFNVKVGPDADSETSLPSN